MGKIYNSLDMYGFTPPSSFEGISYVTTDNVEGIVETKDKSLKAVKFDEETKNLIFTIGNSEKDEQLEVKIPSITGDDTDGLTKEEAAGLYQPKGDYAKKSDIEAAINESEEKIFGNGNLVDAFDTIKEIGDYLNEHGEDITKIAEIAIGKLDKSEYEADKESFETKTNASETYATKAEVEKYVTKENADETYLKGEDIKEYAKKSEISGLIQDEYTKKSDLGTLLDAYAQKEDVNDKFSRCATKQDVLSLEENKQDKGDYVSYSKYDGRKIIQLANFDAIGSVTTEGEGVNVAMVSKWNVVDLGSKKVHINLNGKEEHPTYNDEKQIAFVDDIPNVDGFITEEDANRTFLKEHQSLDEYTKTADLHLDQYAKKEDVEFDLAKKQDVGNYVEYKKFEGTRKTIQLENRDTISATSPKGGSQIAMVSDYEGLDFPVVELGGQNGALVLNSCEDRVKVEVVEDGKRKQHSIATLDDLKDVVKYEGPDIDGGGKLIILGNNDKLMGKVNPDYTAITTDQAYVTIGQVNKWNCVDLGNPHVPVILNTPVGIRPLVQEAGKSGAESEQVAYLSEINALTSEISALKSELNALKNEVKQIKQTPEEIKADMEKGGDFTLTLDLSVNESILLRNPTNIDIGGNVIENTEHGYDAFKFAGGVFTIKNGVVNNTKGGGASAAFYLNSSKGTELTLEDVEAKGVYCIYLNNAAIQPICTIKSGTYTSPNEKGVAVYVEKGGKAIIEGGYFTTDGHDSTYLLNLKDDLCPADGSVDPRNYILVKGGTFVNFNPSASNGEPLKPCNFVAEGYHVEEKVINETTTEYTVVKDE